MSAGACSSLGSRGLADWLTAKCVLPAPLWVEGRGLAGVGLTRYLDFEMTGVGTPSQAISSSSNWLFTLLAISPLIGEAFGVDTDGPSVCLLIDFAHSCISDSFLFTASVMSKQRFSRVFNHPHHLFHHLNGLVLGLLLTLGKVICCSE